MYVLVAIPKCFIGVMCSCFRGETKEIVQDIVLSGPICSPIYEELMDNIKSK